MALNTLINELLGIAQGAGFDAAAADYLEIADNGTLKIADAEQVVVFDLINRDDWLWGALRGQQARLQVNAYAGTAARARAILDALKPLYIAAGYIPVNQVRIEPNATHAVRGLIFTKGHV